MSPTAIRKKTPTPEEEFGRACGGSYANLFTLFFVTFILLFTSFRAATYTGLYTKKKLAPPVLFLSSNDLEQVCYLKK